jgi:hypothetical protein
MDRRGHLFPSGGRCVWCKVAEERVMDRRAPPFCPERPDAYDCDDPNAEDVSPWTGY